MLPDKEIADFAHGYRCALLAKYDLSSQAEMQSGYRRALLAKYDPTQSNLLKQFLFSKIEMGWKALRGFLALSFYMQS